MMNTFKNRLIVMTTGFVFIILIAAFVSIYAINYIRIQSDNKQKLYQQEELRVTSNGEVRFGQTSSEDDDAMVINRIIPGAGVYFNLLVDQTGEIMAIDSALDLSDEQYAEASQYAWKNKKGGKLKLAGRSWQFIVMPATVSLTENDNQQENKDGTQLIRFLDITDTGKSLFSLAGTLVIVGMILMLVFFFIIVYFANRATKPMEEAWGKQKQFIADASHELKTPLSIIAANAGVLYTNKEATVASQVKWLDNISQGTDRMNGLVDKLLTVAKTDNLLENIVLSKLDISKVVSESLSACKSKFDQKGIRVINKLPSTFINADKSLLRQLIDIFIDNAYKYTNRGGEFEVSLKSDDKIVQLSFKNSGEGMEQEELSRIFERFYRADDVRQKYEGSYGLGLSIAQTIVEKFAGRVHVTSEPGKVTEFVVILPLKR